MRCIDSELSRFLNILGLLLNARMFKCQASQISMRVYKSQAFRHKLTLNEQTFFNG